MKRIRIHHPGDYDRLRVEQAEDPQPAAGQVRIAVEACGVNYADGIVRMGLYASARELHGYPITPGFEVAGRIDAIGSGVERARLGEAVIGLTLFNGYSSMVCVDADQAFPLPAGLSMAQGASLPTVFLTAWFMVHQQLYPRVGERWLVHSAAGGVGSALVQLGRLAGCEVTGVVGAAHKVEYCRRMGAHHVIDKSSTPLWPATAAIAPAGFDAIFDANGVATLRRSFDHLAPTGRLVIYGFHSMLPRNGRVNWLRLAWDWLRTPRFNPLQMTQHNRSVLAANLSFLQSHAPRLREGMRWLLRHFEAGELQPLPVESFPLEQVADAHRRIESGHSVGKLVLTP